MIKLVLISLAVCAISTNAAARPVSYAGGWTLIEETNRQSSSALVHYSPAPNYSVGLKLDWDRQSDLLFTGVQGTWLAKRWFGENFQANLYGWGAIGVAQGIDGRQGKDQAAGQFGILADWETRRLFVSYKATARDYGTFDRSALHVARLGFAPYEGDTGDLHTWVMVELDQRPELDEPIGVTPLLRFLYGSMLIEGGWSVTDDQPLLNFQYRF